METYLWNAGSRQRGQNHVQVKQSRKYIQFLVVLNYFYHYNIFSSIRRLRRSGDSVLYRLLLDVLTSTIIYVKLTVLVVRATISVEDRCAY